MSFESPAQSTEKNINDKWLDNIYNILIRLEESEKLAREGCRDLIEYIQNDNNYISVVQYKNFSLFMTDFEILLNNCKEIIGDRYDNFNKNIKKIQELETKFKGFLKVQTNHINNTRKYTLHPVFYDVIKIISKMRRDIVTCLWKLLSPSAEDNYDKIPE